LCLGEEYELTLLFTSISVSRTLASIFIIELSSRSSSLVATAAATSMPGMPLTFRGNGGSSQREAESKMGRRRYRLALSNQEVGGEGTRKGAERGGEGRAFTTVREIPRRASRDKVKI